MEIMEYVFDLHKNLNFLLKTKLKISIRQTNKRIWSKTGRITAG